MAASITIIVAPIDDPDQFEAMYLDERRHRSAGWQTFPLGSGRLIDSFFMLATGSDLGVFASAAERDDDGAPLQSCMIDHATILHALPKLAALVETAPEPTARALLARAGADADADADALGRILAILDAGEWPTTGHVAEEAAAFAHHLLRLGRTAIAFRLGVCWELRGEVT